MVPVVSYPKALYYTLTYCEKKDYALCCLHEAFKVAHELYHDQQLQDAIAKVITDLENKEGAQE